MTGPTFLGIGVQKAGTTWLHAMLARHPAVSFAVDNGQPVKEVHFWNRKRERGLGWYCSLFAGQPPRGEITPAYALLPVETIAEIHRLNPDMRILCTLRNPVERAWSAANMRVRLGRAGPGLIYRREAYAAPNMMRRADYTGTLRAWRSVFGEESVLVRRYEDITLDPRGFLQACARHIGADPGYYEKLDEAMLRQTGGVATDISIPPELYEYLRALYRPHVLEIERLLGWDLAAWLVDYETWRDRGAARVAAAS